MTLQDKIEIRPIAGHQGLLECERLQREIWGFAEQAVVPDHLLLTAIEGGGCLLGAYDGERLIGFVFSLIGLQGGKLKHCSLMAGVLPQARYQGVGYRLKLAQREFALKQGIGLITWTFDPLQSANAHFNFKKLGVLARRYEENYYGDMRDQLNRGLESDRLLVEWWLTSPRVEAKLAGQYPLPSVESLLSQGAEMINRTETERVPLTLHSRGQGEGAQREEGFLVNLDYRLDLKRAKLLLEIPTNTPEMRARAPDLARRWRAETRAIFGHYLSQGYLVSEFIMEAGRGFYLLERASPEEVLSRR
jgi:predicted GNAT superfamily acetyltransferase